MITGGILGFIKEKWPGVCIGILTGGIVGFVVVFVTVFGVWYSLIAFSIGDRYFNRCDYSPNEFMILLSFIIMGAGYLGGLFGGTIGLFLIELFKKPPKA